MELEEIIHSLPAQLTEGIALGKTQRVTRPYRHIISCGMGGSAIAGEILSMIKSEVIVHWDYDLPTNADAQNLVICTSWSGDTEETISSYEKAISQGCETLTITRGGKLAELARANHSPLILLPNTDIPPRTATGYMTGALFAALGLESQLPTNLDPQALESQGKDLAATLGDRIPVIYAAYPWRRLTGFWKMAYSETAKRQVMVNWFPSAAHSEIVGWEGPYEKNMAFVLLRESGESPRYAKNFDALLALLNQKGYTVSNVELSGSTILEKVLNNYILVLWTALFVAKSLGVNPQATVLLGEFKRLKAHK